MIEPISLGAAAALLVAKVAEKGIDKAAGGMVNAVPGAVADVVSWVRQRFGGRDVLKLVEEVPDSDRLRDRLGEVIDAELIEDPPAAAELRALVDAAKAAAPVGYFNIGSISADRGGIATGQLVAGQVTAGYTEATPGGGDTDPHQGSGGG